MARRLPPSPPPKRRVWRISESAPLGEYVDLDAPVPRTPDAPRAPPDPASAGGWMVSSADLLDGAEIDDRPDTVSDADFDQLFPPVPPAPPKPPESER